ncbi:RDD family protein [Gordonia sp. LSe1-13]|uniref:RDD family protein n=1 Tax=Gordonia sesuvii TaxID=3116777 RepID=A0ABU7MFQ6_9ACTN|nr:RDD family protein [Gordonia sp. LSe1-13]
MYGPVPPPTASRGVSATYGVGRDDLVSGEAVALDLPPAGIGLRMVSGLIDLFLGYTAWWALRWLTLKVFGDTDFAMLVASLTLSLITALVIIPTTLETVTRGKTVGHWVTGIRTVRDDAGPIGFRHALTRALLGVIEIYGSGGLPALVAAVCTKKGKRFGDLLAGTYVIRDRHKLDVPEPIPMPPALAGWAQTADVAPLPVHLAIAVRQFLGRRDRLSTQARILLAQRLVHDSAPFVAPAPPTGAPDEMVLAAIMAERRRRDSERIERDQRLRQRLVR